MVDCGTSRSRDSGSKRRQDNELEILFEWQAYRSIIISKRSQLLERLTEVLASFSGKREIQIHTLQTSRKPSKGKQGIFLLQRYVSNWKTYVNVDSIDQVKNRDSLTIITQPSVLSTLSDSSTESPASQSKTKATVKETSGTRDKSGTVPNKSSRVTGVNVFLLQKYTPGSKVPKNEDREELRKAERNKIVYTSRNDDSSHVEEKIKSAFGLRNKYNILESDSKGCKLSLSPLTSLDGNQAIRRRKALYLCEAVVDYDDYHDDERNLKIELSDMSSVDKEGSLDDLTSDDDLPISGVLLPSDTRQRKPLSSRSDSIEGNSNVDLHSTIPQHSSFKIKGKQLKVPYKTGNKFDMRDFSCATEKGLLNHEETDESDSSTDQNFTSLPIRRKRKRKLLKVSHNLANKSDGLSVSKSCLPPKKKNLVEPIEVINLSSDEERQERITEKDLFEWHALHQLQDGEFEESAAVDKLKDKDKEAELKRRELQQKYVDKWTNCLKTSGGLKLSLRLPHGQKINCSLSRNASAKMIYEIAFGIGGISKPFNIFTIRPRKHIEAESKISEVLSVPQTLIIEEHEAGFDPVLHLFQEDASQPHTELIEQGTSGKCDDVSTKCIEHINSIRESYMTEKLITHEGEPRRIQRATVYSDVLGMYMKNLEDIQSEYPFRIQFINERAIDTGGVCRDLYSCFWEHAYIKHFDGDKLLIPAVHANSQISVFPILGTILVHGFFACNFLPVRLAFPIIAAVLRGTDVYIPDCILSESLIDFLSEHDGAILRDAIQYKGAPDFPNDQKTKVISILSKLECSEIPTPYNLKALLISVAKFQFLVKPLGLLYAMRSGFPKIYNGFWEEFTIEEMFKFYTLLNATPSSVIKLIQEPELTNAGENRVYNYLLSLIGNMKQNELRLFLRFVTGSAVLLDKPITVSFNSLGGLARRPISHTCDCQLELSIGYSSYPEFENEFLAVLKNDSSWEMDAI